MVKKVRTVRPFVTAHTFCASREFTKLKCGDFGAVNDYVEKTDLNRGNHAFVRDNFNMKRTAMHCYVFFTFLELYVVA